MYPKQLSVETIPPSHASKKIKRYFWIKKTTDSEEADETIRLSFCIIYEFAIESPLEELTFILDAAKMNKKAAEAARKGLYGHNVSKKSREKRGYIFSGTTCTAGWWPPLPGRAMYGWRAPLCQ